MNHRYQDHPFYIRYLIWLRWIPYAYLRAVYWYLSQLRMNYSYHEVQQFEDLHSCIDISIGGIQATKMRWIYSAEECMRVSKRNLCDSCTKEFATCESNPIFGDGIGNDNVCGCKVYSAKA